MVLLLFDMSSCCGPLTGIRKFLRTHVCNDLCRYFQLPPVQKSQQTFQLVVPFNWQPPAPIDLTDANGEPQQVPATPLSLPA